MAEISGKAAGEGVEVEQLKLKIEALITAMHDNLDPFEDVAEPRLDIVASQATDVAGLQTSLKKALAEIKAIKKALGRRQTTDHGRQRVKVTIPLEERRGPRAVCRRWPDLRAGGRGHGDLGEHASVLLERRGLAGEPAPV